MYLFLKIYFAVMNNMLRLTHPIKTKYKGLSVKPSRKLVKTWFWLASQCSKMHFQILDLNLYSKCLKSNLFWIKGDSIDIQGSSQVPWE